MLGRGLAASTLVALIAAAPAGAQSVPFAPYDGSNPFNCELQQAGQGDVGPHPEVDPYCVEFDKTTQNITDSGLIEFLALEPARVGAAGPKCFYYQHDHWTGWVVQDTPPELWHWDGGYYFDKARGVGGVHVANFRILGQAQNPGQFAPPAYQPYFDDSGGGGFQFTQLGDVDPTCVAKVDTPEEREQVYGDTPVFPECIPPGGELRKRKVGRVPLGLKRGKAIAKLGEPQRRRKGTDRWCLIGNARLILAYKRSDPGKRAGGKRVALIRTSSRGHSEKGVGPATKLEHAKRRLDLEHRFNVKGRRVFEAPVRHGRRLFAGVKGHKVRYLAMVDPARLRSLRGIRRALRRTG